MGLFSNSEYDELSLLIEKATSEFIPAAREDLALNLEITDIIKSRRVGPRDCLRLILSRLQHFNPNVQLLSLQLLDKCVKNGGKPFLKEMAGREFVDLAVSMMDEEEYGQDCNEMVQDKLTSLFQDWALIFQSDFELAYLCDTYAKLKQQRRVVFPEPSKALDSLDPLAIVSTLAPPEWSDACSCMRCRSEFTFSNRKHHCRRCGGVFCHLCSTNEMPLLNMGITDAVRVCDTCYEAAAAPYSERALNRRAQILENDAAKQPAATETGTAATGSSTSIDEDLRRAIELSLNESQPPSDEALLKQAIEASIKESHESKEGTVPQSLASRPAHQPQAIQRPKAHKALTYFDPMEIENISLFHQLICKLRQSRSAVKAEDAIEIHRLAEEMRGFLKRPIEDVVVERLLTEALTGYEQLQSTASATSDSAAREAAVVPAANTSNSAPAALASWTSTTSSDDLGQLKNKFLQAADGVMNTTDTAVNSESVAKAVKTLSLETLSKQQPQSSSEQAIASHQLPLAQSQTNHAICPDPSAHLHPHPQQQQHPYHYPSDPLYFTHQMPCLLNPSIPNPYYQDGAVDMEAKREKRGRRKKKHTKKQEEQDAHSDHEKSPATSKPKEVRSKETKRHKNSKSKKPDDKEEPINLIDL